MATEVACRRCVQALGLGIRRNGVTSGPKLRQLARLSHSYRTYSTPSRKNISPQQQRQLRLNGCRSQIRGTASLATSQEASTSEQSESKQPLLRRDNLFHSYSNSPSPQIRKRAQFIKQHAFCPHPDHQQTRASVSPVGSEAEKPGIPNDQKQPPAHAQHECPDCGVPIYCSEEHWMDDFEAHLQVCETIRQINEDDHDLQSGRFFTEFDYPGYQADEIVVNMTNWDTFLYTREFEAVNDDRSMRQVTRLLTYPVTIASVLHELSPYNISKGGRLTPEGLKSLSGELFAFFDYKCTLSPGSSSNLRIQLYAIPYTHQSQAREAL